MDPSAHAGAFTWKGDLALGPHGNVVELQINDARRGELPDVNPNDPLPEVGPFLPVWLGEVETTLYRYMLVPRGLRALYADRRMLSVFCVYLEVHGNRYLFRLVADQVSTKDGARWLKQQVGELEPAYLRGDVGRLVQTPLYQVVARFLADEEPVEARTELVLAEVAAERGGEIHFLHAPRDPEPGPYRLRLPAAPGDTVSLAMRLEEVRRQVRIRGVEVRREPCRRGTALALARVTGETQVEIAGKSDREGWVQFPEVPVEGPREWRFRVGGGKRPVRLEGALVLRWGRPEEAALDGGAPRLPGRDSRSGDVASWRRVLSGDLAASWDPDRGHFRCVTPGQSLPLELMHLDSVDRLGVDAPWVEDSRSEARRLVGRRGADLPALLRFALGCLGAAATRKAVEAMVAAHEQEPLGVWTQDWARLVGELARALARRADRGLLRLLQRCLEGLAHRIEAEPEPTWRYRGHGRPVKTFKANNDVAQPHAEAVLALVQGAALVPGAAWVLEVAEAQGMHLVEHHPLDGQPPGWVLGAWRERARLETPVRIGKALDLLQRRLESPRLAQRAERVRHLVWNRFLGYYETVEIEERFLLLDWLTTCPA